MKRAALILVLLLLVAAGGTAGAWTWFQNELAQPFKGYSGEVEIEIAPGTGTPSILTQLQAAGIVRDSRLVRAYLRLEESPSLQAGRYQFTQELTIPQVIDRLHSGDVLLRNVTIIEGLTLEEAAEQLANQGFGSKATYLSLLNDPRPILDLDPEAETLEGYLYPDTYHFPFGSTEADVVAAVLKTFRGKFQQEVATLLPPGSGRSTREIVTLASIIEKEAQLDEERPTIASVYANRLQRGIALYADPTVIFALRLAGRWDGNIRKGDLSIDSPYNTYVYPGLPPGPICSPGVKSLIAAAAPAQTPYLYFVSRNDGSHVFAATLREHNRNVEQWQRRYWRDRWARERAAKENPSQ